MNAPDLKPCPWLSQNGYCLAPRCSCRALTTKGDTDERA
jgi:hypothetical protein